MDERNENRKLLRPPPPEAPLQDDIEQQIEATRESGDEYEGDEGTGSDESIGSGRVPPPPPAPPCPRPHPPCPPNLDLRHQIDATRESGVPERFQFEPAKSNHIRTRRDEYENLELLFGQVYPPPPRPRPPHLDLRHQIDAIRESGVPERFQFEPAKGNHIRTRRDEYENLELLFGQVYPPPRPPPPCPPNLDLRHQIDATRENGVPERFQFEPAKGNHIRKRRNEYENLELLGQVYHLASGGSGGSIERQPYSSSTLREFRSPMYNTMLHVAALHGNDDMVDQVVSECPILLDCRNKNQDTPLHVAARAGHISTLRKLLEARPHVMKLLSVMKLKNNRGNTLLHEAMMSGAGRRSGAASGMASMICQLLQAIHDAHAAASNNNNNVEGIGPSSSSLWAWRFIELLLRDENKEGQTVLQLAVEARLMEAVSQILKKCHERNTPLGISPLVVAIMMRNKDMLNNIVTEKRDWIHLADKNERLPIHCASSTGYHEGVVYLLEKCKTCSIERDIYGLLPIHLVAGAGHVEVIKELLGYCPDLNEMLDDDFSNILHIAAKCGKLDVVRYILQNSALMEMINQKDVRGDTPLHVATSSCYPKIVYALTWDDRVKIDVVNQMNKTPLDIALENYGSSIQKRPLRQLLTWVALKSAGAKRSARQSLKTPPNTNTDRYKDRVDSLSVISVLIVTASVAACFAVPGEAQGKANNLHKAMFHFFIFCITISFFSSISATIMLIWGRLGMIELLNFAIKWAMRLIGAALITLSLAFLAGIYTVISKLTWLATTFVVITAIFIAILCVQYIFHVLPSPSTRKFLRYISHYPFIFLASLTEEGKP